MIDPYAQAIAELRAQLDTEAEQAKRGSPFADEDHWTASAAAIERLLLEHFRTTSEPAAQRAWMLMTILMEQDLSRTIENSDDILFRSDISDAEVLAAWRSLVDLSDDPGRDRAAIYNSVIIERAQLADDGQAFDAELAADIGLQLVMTLAIDDRQQLSALVN